MVFIEIVTKYDSNGPNMTLKTRKRISLRNKYFKTEYFKVEATKINQSAISRELENSSQEVRINFETSSWEMLP